jgi:hypothetical protein
MMMTTRTFGILRQAAAMLVAVAALTTPGIAEDKKPSSLPGVNGGYSIVAPEPDEPAEKDDGPLQVGKWELTISGYVWVQVGSPGTGDGR